MAVKWCTILLLVLIALGIVFFQNSKSTKEGILFYSPYDEEEQSVDDLGYLSDSEPLDDPNTSIDFSGSSEPKLRVPWHPKYNPYMENDTAGKWEDIDGPL